MGARAASASLSLGAAVGLQGRAMSPSGRLARGGSSALRAPGFATAGSGSGLGVRSRSTSPGLPSVLPREALAGAAPSGAPAPVVSSTSSCGAPAFKFQARSGKACSSTARAVLDRGSSPAVRGGSQYAALRPSLQSPLAVPADLGSASCAGRGSGAGGAGLEPSALSPPRGGYWAGASPLPGAAACSLGELLRGRSSCEASPGEAKCQLAGGGACSNSADLATSPFASSAVPPPATQAAVASSPEAIAASLASAREAIAASLAASASRSTEGGSAGRELAAAPQQSLQTPRLCLRRGREAEAAQTFQAVNTAVNVAMQAAMSYAKLAMDPGGAACPLSPHEGGQLAFWSSLAAARLAHKEKVAAAQRQATFSRGLLERLDQLWEGLHEGANVAVA